ncbi:hypothetical protein [Sphingomonas sp. LaA6.9]|uniref:hypothetical protein n=1 Tax=Sphingomonas sp. LaA6.9 TaxID=2919914 RepID=UPI001F4F94C6|nr:hypothetical protein [Sphingomonas sp. LaA6.9]MCJ8158562.1 hypothetical protein [Sphingomonas sp. LaA6.9]
MAGRQQPDPDFAQFDVFEGGPPRRISALVRLPAPLCPNVASRVLLVILIGWAPLVALAYFADRTLTPGSFQSFVRDVGTQTRYLVAAPLMVLGWRHCARRLGSIALHFRVSGVLDNEDQPTFEEILRNARRWVNSLWVEAAMLLAIYAVILPISVMPPLALLPAWAVVPGGGAFSYAGLWHLIFSLPLLLLLMLGWLWRIIVWTIVLSRISRLRLNLIAAHPDQSAGLGFLCQSVRSFSIVGAALGSIAAGRFANVHLAGQATPFTDGLLVGGIALVSMLIFVAPLAVFSSRLAHVWRQGSMIYGALATELGAQFEQSWFADARPVERQMLSEPDFSAATDLYQVVSNVYAMRFVPVDVRSLIILLGATLAPFVPAMFLSMPTEAVLTELRGLFF